MEHKIEDTSVDGGVMVPEDEEMEDYHDEIEDTIADQGLPVNTIAMANRLIAILEENNVNAYCLLRDKDVQLRYRRVLWLIMQQVHGQMGSFDMGEEWEILTADMG